MHQLNEDMQNESLCISVLKETEERTCILLFVQQVWYYQCKSAEVQRDMRKVKMIKTGLLYKLSL